MSNASPLGLKDLAKFPFLEESMDLIKSKMKDIKIEELDENRFSEIIKKVEKRTIISIKKGIAPIFDDMFVDVYSELLSFFISLIVIKGTEDPYIISRYCLAEARRAEILLKNELRSDRISASVLEYIFKSTTKSQIYRCESPLLFKLHFIDYLRLTSQFQSPSWKLTNRVLDSGYVYLKDKEVIRLIREGVYRLLYYRINSFPKPILSSKLKSIVEEVKKVRPATKSQKRIISPKEYPPCIEHILSKIEHGENISHFSRFFITTYFLAIGWDVEKIISIFSKMPDFKESIARYQVEHIAGLRGGRKRYSVPSCKLISTYGLCFRNENCKNIRNPLRYKGRK